jgi:LmbE family N-acetylglucosaminyl deacetylase
MNILAFGAHPDDIEFFCAGTLLKYAKAGHAIFVALTTSGNIGSNIMTSREEERGCTSSPRSTWMSPTRWRRS